MKVFVWKYLPAVSDNYHSEGGLIVFAEGLERAKELAAAQGVRWEPNEGEREYRQRWERDHPDRVAQNPWEWDQLDPDEIRFVRGGTEAVYVMPDAGCC